MTTAVQRRRGTNTEHASFTGLEGEISVNTTNESVHVHDGSTAGGFELMRADGANSTVTLGDISGVTAGTGLSGGGTTGTVTLDIDGTVATLAGTQTFTNKTLTSPILNTPTIGTSFTIGGATITETELEILDGATVTTTELNYVDGVTSSIQTQIDAKAPLASPSFTGNVSVGGTVDGRDVAADGTKLDLINQGVATTDSPAFAGLTVDTDTLYVDSTNNRVGVGTTSPSRTLHLKEAVPAIRLEDTDVSGVYHEIISEANTGYCIRVDEGNVASGSYFRVDIDNSEKMRIDNSGNVGIGTSSPNYELSVHESSANADARIQLTNADTGTTTADGFQIIMNGANAGRQVNLLNREASPMAFWTSNAERMRIDSSGKVGIGTTSPNKKLVVNENGSECVAIIKSSDTGTAGLYLGGQTDEIKGGIVFNNSDNSLQLRGYNNAERMRIGSSGTVSTTGSIGVGRTSVSAATEDAGIVLSSAGYIYSAREGTSNQSHIVFINNAAVTATTVGTIRTSGSATSYNTSSDYRLKTDAQPMTGATARLKALKPVNFEWISDGTRVDGFLAHEAQAVVPECVSGEKDAMQEDEYEVTPAVLDEEGNTVEEAVMGTRSVPDYQGIDQSKLVPLLVATIQELEARITQLENN